MSKSRLYVFICISVVLFICLLILFSPMFTIAEIEITGNEKLTEAYIKKTSGLDADTNILVFSSNKARKALKENQYVEQVKIVKEFPDKIVIKITERHLSGYIEYMGRYLYMDENGRVLEVSSEFTERLPVIVGLEFKEFNIGKILDVDNESAFNTVVTLARLFNKYEMQADIIRVDVTKDDDIHLFIYQIDVEFGDIKDADLKVRTIKEIMAEMPGATEVKGFLDIKNINVSPRFRLLT